MSRSSLWLFLFVGSNIRRFTISPGTENIILVLILVNVSHVKIDKGVGHSGIIRNECKNVVHPQRQSNGGAIHLRTVSLHSDCLVDEESFLE